MTATFGEHGTLHHGDCLAVLPTLADGSVSLVFADLPYGITANPWDCAIPLDRLWPEFCRVGKPNCVFVFTATMRFARTLLNSQAQLFRHDIVWEKAIAQGFLSAKKMPLRAHEHVLVFCAKAVPYTPQKTPAPVGHGKIISTSGKSNGSYGLPPRKGWVCDGTRYPRSVQKFECDRAEGRIATMHPTQKPVTLLRWLIATYSRPGDLVLDPTSGVASTAVAALREGRRYVCVERDAGYHAIARERVAAEVSAAQPPAAPAANSFAARAAAWADSRRTARQS